MDINLLNTELSGIMKSAGTDSKYDNVLKKDYSDATEKELMDACKTFEAYFVEQMFKSMQKTVPESEYTSSASKTTREFFNEQLLAEYANKATENGEGFGIAKALYEQMKNNYGIKADKLTEN